MNKLATIRALGWLIGLLLLFCWNLQVEANPGRIAPRHPIQSTESFNVSNPAIDLPPLSLTATVGTPFSYALPALILSGNVTYTATGLPANGLTFNGNPLGPTISGTPITAGVLSVTVTATPSLSDPTLGPPVSAFYIITINPAPDTPPVEPVITSLTATVGTSFSYSLPTALIPSTNVIYTAIGLPANGLSFTGSPIPPTISGTPTTAGVLSVTITATPNNDPTLGPPVSAFYIITINPAPDTPPGAGALTLLAPTYNCATGAFTFNTSGGDGSPITFAAIGITGPTTNPNQFVDTDLRTAADAPLITLSAIQNGTLITYVWNIRAVCPVGPGTPPINPPGGALTLLAPTYNCTTGAFTFNTSGGNGSAITFSAIGITGPTTNPNQFVDTGLRTAADAPLITLLATQNGTTVTYVWNIRAQCPVGPATPPVNPPAGSALTLLAPTYNCATGAFTFNTSGGNATPIEYRAVPGITDWTANPNQFVDEGSRTASDVQPFLLQARQSGAVTTLVWDLKAACGRARLGAAEPEPRLRVVVLGNPVVGETVPVEVSGAEGQPLRVSLTNAQGRLVSEQRIDQAAATERVRVKLSRSAGVYLLQVSSPDQTQVVRVLKSE